MPPHARLTDAVNKARPAKRRRFPWISLLLVIVSGATCLWLEDLSSTHCAFGFGGFQCNAPVPSSDLLLAGSLLAFGVLLVSGITFIVSGIRFALGLLR